MVDGSGKHRGGPNADEAMAERLATLALLFMNARHAIPTSELLATAYPDLSRDSAERAFGRDRARLRDCGIEVVAARLADGTEAYEVDEDASFARAGSLTARDALVLDMACRPLLDDPSFPHASELRLALAKVNRGFAAPTGVGGPAGATPSAAGGSGPLGTVRSCLVAGHACHISYRDAAGRHTERDIAPFGLFGLRGTVYVVAAAVEGDVIDEGRIRTYNSTRILAARERRGVRFEVPDDFYVEDFVRLPFQIGPTTTRATMLVPTGREQDVRREVRGRGSLLRADGRLELSVDVSDVGAAARWAAALGLVPLEPGELVSAWEETLSEACDG